MFEQPVVANRAMLKFVEILSKFVEFVEFVEFYYVGDFLDKFYHTMHDKRVTSTPRVSYLLFIGNDYPFDRAL